MRELRKDSAFIGGERDAEKAAARAERRSAGRAGWALLQVPGSAADVHSRFF